MTAALVAMPKPGVEGFVDAVRAQGVLGWAWVTGQKEPLPVELRLGDEVVARSVADGLREDLAQNGIGDGRHAFTLQVPDALRGRTEELRVFARTPDGAAVPLGVPSAEDALAERLGRLTRGMEMVLGSQRVLHRNVQAALLAPQAGSPALAEIAAAQASLGEAVATLELFVARLELGLSGLSAPAATAGAPRWALAGVAAAAGTALALSVWALLRAMPG